jgi:Hsp70 protein
MSDGWILAIDFGTTNTTAAMAAADGGGPVVLEIENSRYLPSVVYRDETGQLVTGRSAVRQAVAFPERAERVPKRAMVAGDQVLLGGEPVPVTDLVAAVLGRVYGEAVRFHGGQPPTRTVLTYPARWGTAQRDRLQAAAAVAGIGDTELVAEPVAAAWWYARPSAGRVVAVFDFGGGTLDTAVLRATATGYEIAGPPGGDASLGGEDFDELLLAKVSDLARERDPDVWAEQFEGAGARARRDQALLRADVTAAKETLSDHLTTDLAVVGYADPFRLTRTELEELIGPAVASGVDELRQTIAAAGLEPGQVDGIYLTGGSSRVPLISARVAQGLGVLPELRDDPKAVVALGSLAASTAPPPAAQPTEPPPAGQAPGAQASGAQAPGPGPRRGRHPALLPLLAGLGVLLAAGAITGGVLASRNTANNTGPDVVTTTTTLPVPAPTTTTPVPTPTTTTPVPTPTTTTPVPTTPDALDTLDSMVPSGIASYCQTGQPTSNVQGWSAGLVCNDSGIGYDLTYTLFDSQSDLDNYYSNTVLPTIGLQENQGYCLSSSNTFAYWSAPCESGYNYYQITGRMTEFVASGLFEIATTYETGLVYVTIAGVDSASLLSFWDLPTNWIVSST